MDDTKDDRKKHKRSHHGDASKEGGEPGGEDPGGHPFDREVHPADESALRASPRKRSKNKR